ncbi:hypothetical protein [Mesomycoplasma bovoculi]|uniref:Uncharacterized protein n=1 Tax=Mesomycoplasma bovoculi M165/69 TaxID=743966 RepID=W5UTN1_9BACT|nr:hypothetical protein [Mesomycoplasma bovoculi]AHH45180.1 hypothetical protein MYB_00838 [Mesomycoplasma bovoculi M165/69]
MFEDKKYYYFYKFYQIWALKYSDPSFCLEQTSQDIFDKFPIVLH